MKRRLLSAFLAVMMVLTMAPVAFAADSGEVSSTEEVSTAVALQTALTNATDGTVIKLTDNITVSSRAKFSGQSMTVTLDLNNYTLTGSDGDYALSNENGNGATTGKLIVKNGTIKRADDVKQSNSTVRNYGQMELNNVQVQGNYIVVKNEETATLTMNNCTLTAPDVYGNNQIPSGLQNYGTATANNCTIKSGTAVMAASWADSKQSYNSNTYLNNCTISGSPYAVSSGRTDKSTAKQRVNVNGGSYTGNIDSGAGSDITINAEVKGNMRVVNDFSYNLGSASYITSGPSKVTLAEGGSVSGTINAAAKNGNTYYSTVTNAVEEATNGNTIELVQDTTEDVVIPADKTVTLDLNGKTLTNSAGDTITVALGANLTIEGEGTVDNISHGKAAVYNNGFVTLNGGTYTRSKETGDVKVDKNSYYNILNHGSMTINKDVTVEQSGNFSSLVVNGYYDYEGVTSKGEKSQYIEGTNVAEPTLTIKGGTFSGGINTLKNDDGGNITINGGTVTNYTQAALQNHNVATINGGTFTADSKYVIDDCGCNEAHDSGELMIFGGTFMGKLYVRSPYSKVTIMDGLFKGDVLKTGGTLSTIGGYYSTDVAKYCPIGWTTVANTDKDTKDAYPYTIGVIPEIKDNEVKADVATGATNSTVDTEKITTEAAQNAATTVANTVATTKPIADKSELTENDKKNAVTALKNAGQVTVDADGTISKNVTVIKQTYLDVTATEYVIGDTDDTYRVTMDITPKYNLVAVATENNEAVDVAKGVAYLQGQYLMNAGKTEVTVTLPTQYANKKVYITHKDDVYIATADENGKITFTTNGFSPFTFTLSNPNVVAEVNGNAYKSLQEAANAANNGDEITVIQNKNLDLTFNTTKSVKVTNKTDDKITVKFNGTNKDVAKNATETFSYTKPSSGSSSGGSSSGKTTYKVTTSAVNNGGVNASPSNAEKGATITITLSPNKGYKLDKLTVTDGSGKSVSTVKKSDTVYTFTMPASAVKVGVSYVKATETPSETKFNDVSANDWFASAVDYVTGKGMMNGTADNTFSPKANTTRGMVVTVLYRLENQPSTSAASFTDVASGAYYANAVAWANANGIVSGYGSGKFGPNDKVTREQLAAILYRYAQYKKYDVSGAKSLDGYTDAQSVSSYAVPALQWANAVGVVTGKSGNKLDPKGNATRAEVAAMLMRFCENVK